MSAVSATSKVPRPAGQTAFKSHLAGMRKKYYRPFRALAINPYLFGMACALITNTLPALGIVVPVSAALEGIRVLINRKSAKEHEPDLLAQMVASSREVESSLIARELRFNGTRKLNKKFLAALEEADGTRFNEVVVHMQARRLRAASIIRKIAMGVMGLGIWAHYTTSAWMINNS